MTPTLPAYHSPEVHRLLVNRLLRRLNHRCGRYAIEMLDHGTAGTGLRDTVANILIEMTRAELTTEPAKGMGVPQ